MLLLFYFQVVNINIEVFSICVISIIVIVAFLLWFFHGKDKIINDILNFYPPKGYSSLEVGYIANKDKVIKYQNIMSLFMDLVNKEYIELKKLDKNYFKISKLKEYEGKNHYERLFFNKLFKNGNELEGKELNDYMSEIVFNLRETINKHGIDTERIYEERSLKNRKILNYFIVLICFLVLLTPMLDLPHVKLINYNFFDITTISVDFGPVDMFILLFTLSIGLYIPQNIVRFKSRVIKIIILAIAFILCIVSVFIARNEIYHYINFVTFGIISLIIIVFLNNIMIKITNKGSSLLEKINGFKNFLIYAEKTELEVLLDTDPLYFYYMMPYAYSLNISNVIEDKLDKKIFDKFYNIIDFNNTVELVLHETFDNLGEFFYILGEFISDYNSFGNSDQKRDKMLETYKIPDLDTVKKYYKDKL